jgi:hypothetical protein
MQSNYSTEIYDPLKNFSIVIKIVRYVRSALVMQWIASCKHTLVASC